MLHYSHSLASNSQDGSPACKTGFDSILISLFSKTSRLSLIAEQGPNNVRRVRKQMRKERTVSNKRLGTAMGNNSLVNDMEDNQVSTGLIYKNFWVSCASDQSLDN